MTQLQTKKFTVEGALTEEHVEHDPAKIPAPFLTHAQIRDLQAEVMRLRLKRRHQREAIASLNRAHERHLYLLARSNADRSVLHDEYEAMKAKYVQIRGADAE